MSDDKLVEAVARAICRAECPPVRRGEGCSAIRGACPLERSMRNIARAALAAMPRPGSERSDALEEAAKLVTTFPCVLPRPAMVGAMVECDRAVTVATRQIAAAIRALKDKPLPAQGGWQPIETAPKNGTRILAYWPCDGWREIVRWENDKVGWRGEASGYWAAKDYPPLWQPLPPPPEKADDHGA